MKKMDGEDYKEGTIKTMWNQTAKLLQEKYLNDFDIKINPFSDAAFKTARGARDAKRKALQSIPEKRRASAAALEEKDWDEREREERERRKRVWSITTLMLPTARMLETQLHNFSAHWLEALRDALYATPNRMVSLLHQLCDHDDSSPANKRHYY
ncbi:unnamed protein product [Pieris macdunnoughi]|uniref:Uncharacterized protein n=1 Tax=Pieris macdunnoughi TaxID=345717 RepID=A0A821T0T4_9NEOP|nr:unnamed protein product [Pieris macdunnoughi]